LEKGGRAEKKTKIFVFINDFEVDKFNPKLPVHQELQTVQKGLWI
jgi:hypothetical protein